MSGLRVLDVTKEPDALIASSFLADVGADVIVLETPGRILRASPKLDEHRDQIIEDWRRASHPNPTQRWELPA